MCGLILVFPFFQKPVKPDFAQGQWQPCLYYCSFHSPKNFFFNPARQKWPWQNEDGIVWLLDRCKKERSRNWVSGLKVIGKTKTQNQKSCLCHFFPKASFVMPASLTEQNTVQSILALYSWFLNLNFHLIYLMALLSDLLRVMLPFFAHWQWQTEAENPLFTLPMGTLELTSLFLILYKRCTSVMLCNRKNQQIGNSHLPSNCCLSNLIASLCGVGTGWRRRHVHVALITSEK